MATGIALLTNNASSIPVQWPVYLLQGMYGGGFQHIDYAVVYPSKRKVFHNWGIGAADFAIYPPGTVPQDWPGLGDPPFSFSNPEPWEMRSIERTLTDLGHSNRTLSVLKIDVEG